MRAREVLTRPYAAVGHDPVRRTFEQEQLARMVPRLLETAGGSALLELGCADGLAGRVVGVERYLGIDLEPSTPLPALAHDLRDGLGPVGARPFDVYFGYFGIASHLAPGELARLLREIARHARKGALVALEALGLSSLEWPGLWELPPGPGRRIPYRLGADVAVHPWAPTELAGLFRAAGIDPIGASDRTLQAGPKLAEGRYWPGLPALRDAVADLLCGGPPAPELTASLPPLPAGKPALVHHGLARRRRELVTRAGLSGPALARAIWRLEGSMAGGFGHGLLLVGRVR
jgi:hypothetical protein